MLFPFIHGTKNIHGKSDKKQSKTKNKTKIKTNKKDSNNKHMKKN
jgi:hypothetical protein